MTLKSGLALVACLVVVAGCGKGPNHLTATNEGVQVSPTGTSANSGAVQVTMAGAVPGRGLRSVLSDVAFYRVTLSGNGLVSPQVKLCAAPAGSHGKVSARFGNLAPGTYTMTVEVLDAGMHVLGSDSQQGTVTPGECTYIDLHVKLPASEVTPTTGQLGARVTVEDGGVVTKPIKDCPANEGFVSLDGSSCPVPATPSPSPTPRR